MDHLLSRRAAGATSSVIRDLLHLVNRPGVLSLAGGLPCADGFPTERMAVAAERALAGGGRYGVEALQYGPTEGDAELRRLVAPADVAFDQMLVTTGSQQGLDLVARALIDPGDPVVVEAPGYLGALQAMRVCEPRFVPVRTDEHGLRVDELGALLAAGLRPKLVYTVPNFQNPSGATLSLERRRELGDLADRFGFVVVEDDPYGALRFAGEPLPPVRLFTDNAVTLGSASKVLAPGLRVGWLSAPRWLVGSLVRLKQAADLHTSSLAQRIALDVLSDKAFMAGHLPRIADLYRARCDALVSALDGVLELSRPDGGMFLWCRLPIGSARLDTTEVLPLAVERGVAFVPGAAFFVDGAGHDTMRLSYATLSPVELVEAAGRLDGVLADAERTAVLAGPAAK
jgi:2-aminoadipate transaminase